MWQQYTWRAASAEETTRLEGEIFMQELEETALFKYMRRRGNSRLPGRLLDLRATLEAYLAYIPATFPHYTSHTLRHSEEIIRQLSALLFSAGRTDDCTTDLSGAECYLLMAAAYLHDAGMVASDDEKSSILASAEWREWITAEESRSDRWEAIRVHRTDLHSNQAAHYVADMQVRHLLAEFIRQRHHSRSATAVTLFSPLLSPTVDDDPSIRPTLAAICQGHGLGRKSLMDSHVYPHRRDVLGEGVDVRFLAILLRLGDLLDVSQDRACPFLMSVANPLPPESLPHWTQYQRMHHRVTSPQRVEISAECHTREEHRLLQDWCSWLVEELEGAARLLRGGDRHNDWAPPHAALEGPDRTINIRPSPSATYLPVSWRFEFDQSEVLARLTDDLYGNEFAYIRELLQNAIDATRCQMHVQLMARGEAIPEWLPDAPRELRESLPVAVHLEREVVENEITGTPEQRPVVVVSDVGIGMDAQVVRDYLLQVGRSYYTSPDFHRAFDFVPTSRFGIGFLSVFRVSDHVVVETQKEGGEGLKLTLTGPRNYLLVERGSSHRRGTTIRVRLRQPVEADRLFSYLEGLCFRLEVPITLRAGQEVQTIRSEDSRDHMVEVADPTVDDRKIMVKSFPVVAPGLRGEIYVLAVQEGGIESWVRQQWVEFTFPRLSPQALIVGVPPPAIGYHGLSASNPGRRWRAGSSISWRLDVRSDSMMKMGLARDPLVGGQETLPQPARTRIRDLLLEHIATSELAQGPEAWRYLQRLAESFSINREFALTDARGYRLGLKGKITHATAAEVDSHSVVTISFGMDTTRRAASMDTIGIRIDRMEPQVVARLQASASVPVICFEDFPLNDQLIATEFIQRRRVSTVTASPSEVLFAWELFPVHGVGIRRGGVRFDFAECHGVPDHLAAFPAIGQSGGRLSNVIVLNPSNRFVRWLSVRVGSRKVLWCSSEERTEALGRLLGLLEAPGRQNGHQADALNRFLAAWRSGATQESDRPPAGEFSGSYALHGVDFD